MDEQVRHSELETDGSTAPPQHRRRWGSWTIGLILLLLIAGGSVWYFHATRKPPHAAQAQAELTEAQAKVVFGEKRTQAETEKKVAEVGAEGEKKAKEIEATTEKLRAEIDAKTASIEAQTTRVMGAAKAQSVKLSKEARAERSQLLVKAMGGPDSYERYIFAEGLPADLRVGIFYAGTGTLWTDLKGFEQTMLGKLASESKSPTGNIANGIAERDEPGKKD